jgi:hypothetical protein
MAPDLERALSEELTLRAMMRRDPSGSLIVPEILSSQNKRKRPWSLATLIEGNSVSGSPVGIEIQPGFEGVLVRKNEFVRVKLETRS